MASTNTLLSPTKIAQEALMQLVNNMGMARHVHRQYKAEFGAGVGTTVTIRKPVKFRVTASATRSNTDIVEGSTTFIVNTRAHVSWAFTSQELTQKIEDYSARYITPACQALANYIDYTLTGLYTYVWNSVGTPGVTPQSFKTLADAQIVLDEEAAPQEGRLALLNPMANWYMADALKGTFAPNVAQNIITKGFLGRVANLDIYMDQNIRRHTTGLTRPAAPR